MLPDSCRPLDRYIQRKGGTNDLMNEPEKKQYSRVLLIAALVVVGVLVLCFALFQQPR